MSTKTYKMTINRCKMTTNGFFSSVPRGHLSHNPLIEMSKTVSLFSILPLLYCSALHKNTYLKPVSSMTSHACERKQQISVCLLSCILFINVPSPAPVYYMHCDTRLSKYWPIKGPTMDKRSSIVQPCSRLSIAPELLLSSQILNLHPEALFNPFCTTEEKTATRERESC